MVRFIILLLLPLAGYSQVYNTTQNVIDLNPERDAISGAAGPQRIKAAFTDGAASLDVTGGLPIPLTVKSRIDDYEITVTNSFTNTPPNVVWWEIEDLAAGSYELKATYTDSNDSFPVFWRYLSLTNIGSTVNVSITGITVNASVGVTNQITSSLNIFYWGTNVASITNAP